jgi:antitoxin (DNA-binding transcriptional repressor) of toxin-antitoxin stability system
VSTTTVEVGEFAHRWSELIAAASAGDEVIVTEQDVPKARVIALLTTTGARTPGLHVGLIEIAHDFDAPLPDDFWTGSA